MQIRYSKNEILISGTAQQMKLLQGKIESFVQSKKDKLIVPLELDYNPAPYEHIAKELHILKSDKNDLVVKKEFIILKASDTFLTSIKLNLPSEIDHVPYHIHYDWISFPEFLSQESPELVIEVSSFD